MHIIIVAVFLILVSACVFEYTVCDADLSVFTEATPTLGSLIPKLGRFILIVGGAVLMRGLRGWAGNINDPDGNIGVGLWDTFNK